MKFVFVNGRVAISVRYWEERGEVIDGGARVELRRVEQVEGSNHRPGAAGFTVLPVSDGGLWRADLFMVLSDPGTPCFHYHPRFENNDVGLRFFEDKLTADPAKWIAAQLADITVLLERCDAGDLVPSVDLEEHRRALPLILAAIDACLARIPVAITTSREPRSGPGVPADGRDERSF